MLARTHDMLKTAMQSNPPYGVLAFNVIGLEHAEAIILGSEAERAPVILQISQNAIRYRLDALEPITAACRELAQATSVPVALHLDHATTHDLCVRAAASGMSSVMFDASTSSHERNIKRTAEETRWAHAHGLSIEGELGIVGGKDGAVTSPDGMTDPAAAAVYVVETGVDSLAVAVGSRHGMTEQSVELDFDRISAIRDAVTIPLVLHGSSGISDMALLEAVQRGVTKVNMATQLNMAFTDAVRRFLDHNALATDPRRYGEVGRTAIVDVVRAKCRLVGASGRGSSGSSSGIRPNDGSVR